MAIATLIAAGALDDRLVNDALDRLGGGEPTWLDRGDAAQIRTTLTIERAREALLQFDGADTIVVPDDFAPTLLVADMDSTMIGQECIDELAVEAGVGERVSTITERAMRGELDFAGALRERLGLLKGLEGKIIDDLLASRITENPGASTLIKTFKTRGVRTVLVSGGFTAFAEPIGQRLGFDRVIANSLEVREERLTGSIVGEIVDSATKRRVLEEERGLGQAIAIGDGANDLPMIEAADLGIAYRAKPTLAAAADARLKRSDLSAILWALGIPRERWITN